MVRSHRRDKTVKYTSADPLYYIHNYNLDLNANQIYLMGNESYIGAVEDEPGVEYSMANNLIKNLNILQRKGDQNILIHMKTCGGDWGEG